MDILPTLLGLLGLERPQIIQGKSFAPLLHQPGTDFHDRIFIHWGPRSIVTYDGKLKFGFHANAEVDELYDRSLDPGELKNLALDKRYVEIAREKREEILAWLHETEHPYTPLFKRKKTKALS